MQDGETDRLKIYGQPRSRAFRVLWMANELGVPYEHVPVQIGGDDAECKQDWFRAINPNARVPAIDDNGHCLWESAAINLYLAKKYPNALYPKTVEGEGSMLQWAFFVANDVEPPMISFYQQRMGMAAKRSPELEAEADAKLQPGLRILESQLGRTPFFAGTEWGMADFMAASVLYSLYAIKYDFAKYPKLGSWLGRSVERPAALAARKLRE